MNREENYKRVIEFDNKIKEDNIKKKFEIKTLLENPKFYNNPCNEYRIIYECEDQIYDRTDMSSDIFNIRMDRCDHNIVFEIFNILESSKIHMHRLTIETFHSDPQTGISLYKEQTQLLAPLIRSIYKNIPEIICDRLKKDIKLISGITLKLTFEYHYVNPYL